MFAVIRTGGKQYKVSEGDTLEIELIDAEPGTSTTLSDVLLVAKDADVQIGKPSLTGASVTVDVLGEVKADKVIAYKFRRTEGYHRTVGHRQKLNRVKVTKISA